MTNKKGIHKVCEWCNKPFVAQRFSTRYCSHSCNSKAYKEIKKNESRKQYEMTGISVKKMQEIEKLSDKYEKIKNKEFLSVSETAFLLSVARSTIYRYLHTGVLAAFQTKRKTFIRRKDIDALFDDTEPYKAQINKEKKPITDFYTLKEIMDKFNVKETWIYKVVRENKIPKTLIRGKSHFSKKDIDRYFNQKTNDIAENIENWYSVKELQNKYRLTKAAIYSFVSENCIPKKKEGRNVFYSQKHFDLAKGYAVPEFYSTDEAMQKFNLTRDSLYYHLKQHNIPKVKEGRFIKISKPELDKLFENLIIP